ncbi:tellurite resistance protein [Ectothiorhodosinus mongolicus]|uniref:Tellurite resistance protein n=2 Tax=Ectothiorhodosinus mongolicus TaxID=233100 RepID=A0A1R3VWH3_9GAMM|nr:C4-dicarboxylate ABC transporter [Ectothiorhodosinus mongolicus]SIT69452.1 tellurite resistance protein [Ectothiorhodosinus mongolicus]
MTETMPARLAHFPIAFYAMLMGLLGFAIVWLRADSIVAVPHIIGLGILAFAGLAFLAVTTLYILKFLRHRDAVLAELNHPVKRNFFATFSITLILISIALMHLAPGISLGFWVVGSALQLVFLLYVMSIWINHTSFQIQHMNPAWFIPVVGNIIVPIGGVFHGFVEISWFYFSIGLIFWIVLLGIIFYRVIFHDPLPERLVPTLFILIAPPAVGFLSYMVLTGHLDAFARILVYAAFFFTLLLFTQIGLFSRIKFFLSWWAYSFPMAAMTLAAMVLYEHTGLHAHHVLAIGLLVIFTLIIIGLIYRTALAIWRNEICVPE